MQIDFNDPQNQPQNQDNEHLNDLNSYKKPKPIFLPFEFKADTKEYFKIWIVNIALSIVTLGIYSAWAKVRTNRYMYASTYLNNSNFEYNANPKRILIGRLIVFGFYGLFYLFANILGFLSIAGGIVIIFVLLLPWLIRQAIRFRLKSTTYRNIHFSYKGKTRSFYKLALLGIAIFAIYGGASYFLQITFGKNFGGIISSVLFSFIIIPLLYREYKHLVLNNAYYGQHRFGFDATKKDTIIVFVSIALITFIFMLIFGVIVSFGGILFQEAITQAFQGDIAQIIFTIAFALIASLAIGFYKGLADGFFSNFTRNNTKLDTAHFKGDIEPVSLGFISATNSFAILASVGLLYPWARIRYLKYKFDHTMIACSDYNKFVASEQDTISTVGEEAMDFFDIDIGI